MDELKPTTETEEARYRPTTVKEFCVEYGCDPKTFHKWIKPIQPELGERVGHFYNPRQVRLIRGHVGTFTGFFGFFKWIFQTDPVRYEQPPYSGYINRSAFYPDQQNTDGALSHNNDQDPSHTSDSAIHDASHSWTHILFPVMTLFSIVLMVYNVRKINEVFSKSVKQRAGLLPPNSPDETMKEAILVTGIAIQFTVACFAILFAGYYLGKLIF